MTDLTALLTRIVWRACFRIGLAPRCRGLLAGSLAALPGVLLAAGFGDPRGFLTSQQVSETVIYPGVKYTRADGLHLGRPMVTHVLNVNMAEPAIKLQMLSGERLVSAYSGQFFRRSRVSQLQQDNNALAAINGAFFDISATMTPSGLHVRDGMILKQPSSANRSFAVTETGFPFIGSFGWSGTIRLGGSSIGLQGVNANSIGDNHAALYQYPWDRSPGRDAAFINGREVTEVVLTRGSFIKSQTRTQRHLLRGAVLEVRTNAVSVSLNANNFVLTGTGAAGSFLRLMSAGSTVDVEWLLSGMPSAVDWNRVTEVVSGNNLLIVGGAPKSGSGSHWETLHPRSAVGIDQGKTKVLFLLVEGRQTGRAEGMSLDSLRDYLLHMGVYDGLEFDGGGSSAMAGRVGGNNMLFSTPSDGSERYVPSGLGVIAMPDPPNPFFQNVRVTADHDSAAISWDTPVPAISWVRFGKEGYDTESVRNYTPFTRHTVFLHELEPHSVYFFRMLGQTSSSLQTSQGMQLATGVEVVVDDLQATFIGTWNSGSFGVPYQSGYRWTDIVIADNPTTSAKFRPSLPVTGRYDVYAWYTPGGNRTTAARYDIAHQGGIAPVLQSQATGGNTWSLLTSNLSFSRGDTGFVSLRNDSTVGTVVIADAVRWVLRSPSPLPPGMVPEWWQRHFFGSAAPSAPDPDGDGFNLYQEYMWGTVPNDEASRPTTSFEKLGNELLRLSFSPFRSDRVYQVETSGDLASWSEFDLAPKQQNGVGVADLPIGSGSPRFYRLRVSLP